MTSSFILNSPDFEPGARIAPVHTHDGSNISPELRWSGAPPGVASFVLILEDADAASMALRHWCVFNISAARNHLPRDLDGSATLASVAIATNDFGHAAYDGPKCSYDPAHTYRLRLAALSVNVLPTTRGPTAGDVWDAARDHILAEAEATFVY